MEDNNFEDLASGARTSLFATLIAFMAENKKWWLTPFIVVFALVGLLLILGATGATPFIYALF